MITTRPITEEPLTLDEVSDKHNVKQDPTQDAKSPKAAQLPQEQQRPVAYRPRRRQTRMASFCMARASSFSSYIAMSVTLQLLDDEPDTAFETAGFLAVLVLLVVSACLKRAVAYRSLLQVLLGIAVGALLSLPWLLDWWEDEWEPWFEDEEDVDLDEVSTVLSVAMQGFWMNAKVVNTVVERKMTYKPVFRKKDVDSKEEYKAKVA